MATKPIATGTYTGTTAAVTVTLGFKPIYVKVWNETDGDETWEHADGMTAGTALTNGPSTTDLALQADNAITLTDTGFTAGTDMSEDAKVFRYVAFAGGD